METIKINDVEYIKKEEITSLDFAIKDNPNCCAIIKVPENKIVSLRKLDKKSNLTKKEDVLILEEKDGECILVYYKKQLWGIYLKEFFDTAKEMMEKFGKYWEGVLISDLPDEPILTYGDEFGVLIAPRTPSDIDKFPSEKQKVNSESPQIEVKPEV